MRQNHLLRHARRTAIAAAVLAAMAAGSAQGGHVDHLLDMTFSVDVQGPTAGTIQPDAFFGEPIFGTDVLTPQLPGPVGPNPPGSPPNPGIFIESPRMTNPERLGAPGIDILAATPAGLDAANGWGEFDALSYGHDPIDVPHPNQLPSPIYYAFSVDEFAIGLEGTAVRLEGALGAKEASADTFITRKPDPLPATQTLGTNEFFTDGMDSMGGVNSEPTVGLIEPNAPTVGSGGAPGAIDAGDNLDAVDFDTELADRDGPVYFSLDSAFSDPLEVPAAGGGSMPNYGTAVANGYVGGDVLVANPDFTIPGAADALYAAADDLGLDRIGSADSDDLDALKLHENGQQGYQVSLIPFDWLTGETDMLLFSVRRGSLLIGHNDSIFGIPIEEGDVLTTPCADGSQITQVGIECYGNENGDGTGALLPGIFTAAEQLGLATVRSDTAASYGRTNQAYGVDAWADDLDALDQVFAIPTPGTLALLGLGLGGAFVARRRRSAKA